MAAVVAVNTEARPTNRVLRARDIAIVALSKMQGRDIKIPSDFSRLNHIEDCDPGPGNVINISGANSLRLYNHSPARGIEVEDIAMKRT
ncbi:hypothetical protein GCM10010371_68010 [Streptomyces subrutilus]|uniref:Uncharacterized protein n=1 Tax=Streptomyces subrutilus TaxID=36818 RepID=A0A918RJH8_9ACTN|nr:hypothetical protein GCM10010371_68010 [Streptomyces subrutilus]